MATKKRRWLRWVLPIITVSLIGFVWATNDAVLAGAKDRIYTEVSTVPTEPVGLVLGTAPSIDGHANPYFERRMDAAARLYASGKISKLLVSGDNHSADYDEPTAMRDALVARGVPIRAIALDYAGFRTLDSIVRARKVFGVDHCTIVTDDFHLPRALYIASNEGVEAIGYQTTPLPTSVSPWTHVREVGARSLVWMDVHVLNRQPKFLGPQVSL